MNVALRPEHLNLISICTGGHGLDFGVELAIPGARTVCMVEREAFAVATLVSAMEEGLIHPAPVWSDARTFNGRPWRGAVDGLIGGIPCQPHSLAGKRGGEEDERDLWSDARRIIVQSGAWFVLIENVRGMLSAKEGLDPGALRVRRDLRRLGFEVEGGLFTASEVGASHERERVFILAVADSIGILPEAGRSGSVRAARCEDEGSARLGERRGNDVGDGGVSMADPHSERLQGQRPDAGQAGREDAGRSAGLCGRADLVDPESIGRREGRAEPELWSGRDTASGAGGAVDDASIARGWSVSIQPRRQNEAGSNPHWSGLYPPGPADRDAWRYVLERAPELEPAFCRVADGVASGLDLARCWSRVDRLRQLGNGVVPLEAAYALRTLATRLAARGSRRANLIVRMMEGIEV